ncbi:hypothetical protein H4219_004139 [Mycoemilia scoparia]|uniref:Enoyl reductase (ER) domain-containing protein n=1 Tax=Mycoemilia scoparia TaxID=417184 RepID=A0A9W7ZYB7_9FUNG|nr:hypothetical protein H4219_004139 [Mycoemilia scoparia]
MTSLTLPATKFVYRITERTGPQAIKRFEEPLFQQQQPQMQQGTPVDTKVKPHEILVKIKAVSLNYRDLIISNGFYPFPVSPNVVPGSDGAGEVVQVGEAVKDFQVGDKVVGIFDQAHLYGDPGDWTNGLGGVVDGTLQQYRVFPAIAVIKIPQKTHLSWEEIASLPCTGVTCWNALFGIQPLLPGQTVLVQGTGGVAITGLILAKAAGATVIITSSSDEKLEYVKTNFGADYTINYRTNPDWDKVALQVTNGKGVDNVLEGGGINTIEKSLNAVRIGGVVSVIGFLAASENVPKPDVAKIAIEKGVIIRGIKIGSKQMFEDLNQLVHARKLKIPVNKVFGFSPKEVLRAYEYLESQAHIGKICIRVD